VQAERLRFCFTYRWNQKRPEAASVSELRRFIEEAILLDLKKEAFDTDDRTLIPEAGACTDCPKRTGNDRMLFSDVTKGDWCSDPGCFGRTLDRTVDVRVEALEARGKKVVRISGQYNRTPAPPPDPLTTGQYDRITNEKTCDDTVFGIYEDGGEKGKQIKLCTNRKCTVHGYAAARARGSAQDKEKRAKGQGRSANADAHLSGDLLGVVSSSVAGGGLPARGGVRYRACRSRHRSKASLNPVLRFIPSIERLTPKV
jgi:ParB family chromosome partitioning protein